MPNTEWYLTTIVADSPIIKGSNYIIKAKQPHFLGGVA